MHVTGGAVYLIFVRVLSIYYCAPCRHISDVEHYLATLYDDRVVGNNREMPLQQTRSIRRADCAGKKNLPISLIVYNTKSEKTSTQFLCDNSGIRETMFIIINYFISAF